MKTWLRIGIAVLSVLVSPAAFAQDKGAHPAPPAPPPNPSHAAPAPAPPPPPAVHSAPPPQAVHASPPPATRSGPSAERAVPRDGATPRSTMRDPSLADSSAGSGPSRGGSRGAAPAGSTAGSGERATPRAGTNVATPRGATSVDRGRTTEGTTSNGGRSRGDRPAYGTAVARTHPPHHGGGGGYHPSYPWYYPWYPYSFGLFYWDPLWWGSGYYGGGYDPGYGYGYDSGGSDYGTGSLKLKVKPNDAQVYVDGYFAGLVDDFDGMLQKLNLEVGPHHIEIRAPGYQTLTFDVQIQLDETTTYRGELMKALPQ